MQLHFLDSAARREIVPGMILLRNFCAAEDFDALLEAIFAAAPLRSMTVPGGATMSVATSCCGSVGWTSSASGYAYAPVDPLTGNAWPVLPASWRNAACEAAVIAGFSDFAPDTCLINRYGPDARMGLHQDRDELDRAQPVVSFSFGADAVFYFVPSGKRSGPTQSIMLGHQDALVFGGPARMLYHGVKKLRIEESPFTYRTNLTFRASRSARFALE